MSGILIIGGAVATVLSGATFAAVVTWAKRRYKILRQDYPVDIDAYVNQKPTLMEKIQCALLRRYLRKARDIRSNNEQPPYQIAVDHQAEDLQGLQITRRAHKGETPSKWKKAPLIIGSIRK